MSSKKGRRDKSRKHHRRAKHHNNATSNVATASGEESVSSAEEAEETESLVVQGGGQTKATMLINVGGTRSSGLPANERSSVPRPHSPPTRRRKKKAHRRTNKPNREHGGTAESDSGTVEPLSKAEFTPIATFSAINSSVAHLLSPTTAEGGSVSEQQRTILHQAPDDSAEEAEESMSRMHLRVNLQPPPATAASAASASSSSANDGRRSHPSQDIPISDTHSHTSADDKNILSNDTNDTIHTNDTNDTNDTHSPAIGHQNEHSASTTTATNTADQPEHPLFDRTEMMRLLSIPVSSQAHLSDAAWLKVLGIRPSGGDKALGAVEAAVSARLFRMSLEQIIEVLKPLVQLQEAEDL